MTTPPRETLGERRKHAERCYSCRQAGAWYLELDAAYRASCVELADSEQKYRALAEKAEAVVERCWRQAQCPLCGAESVGSGGLEADRTVHLRADCELDALRALLPKRGEAK